MNEFISFDFKAANINSHSIFSVGVVFVKGGEKKETVYNLTNP